MKKEVTDCLKKRTLKNEIGLLLLVKSWWLFCPVVLCVRGGRGEREIGKDEVVLRC